MCFIEPHMLNECHESNHFEGKNNFIGGEICAIFQKFHVFCVKNKLRLSYTENEILCFCKDIYYLGLGNYL